MEVFIHRSISRAEDNNNNHENKNNNRNNNNNESNATTISNSIISNSLFKITNGFNDCFTFTPSKRFEIQNGIDNYLSNENNKDKNENINKNNSFNNESTSNEERTEEPDWSKSCHSPCLNSKNNSYDNLVDFEGNRKKNKNNDKNNSNNKFSNEHMVENLSMNRPLSHDSQVVFHHAKKSNDDNDSNKDEKSANTVPISGAALNLHQSKEASSYEPPLSPNNYNIHQPYRRLSPQNSSFPKTNSPTHHDNSIKNNIECNQIFSHRPVFPRDGMSLQKDREDPSRSQISPLKQPSMLRFDNPILRLPFDNCFRPFPSGPLPHPLHIRHPNPDVLSFAMSRSFISPSALQNNVVSAFVFGLIVENFYIFILVLFKMHVNYVIP